MSLTMYLSILYLPPCLPIFLVYHILHLPIFYPSIARPSVHAGDLPMYLLSAILYLSIGCLSAHQPIRPRGTPADLHEHLDEGVEERRRRLLPQRAARKARLCVYYPHILYFVCETERERSEGEGGRERDSERGEGERERERERERETGRATAATASTAPPNPFRPGGAPAPRQVRVKRASFPRREASLSFPFLSLTFLSFPFPSLPRGEASSAAGTAGRRPLEPRANARLAHLFSVRERACLASSRAACTKSRMSATSP